MWNIEKLGLIEFEKSFERQLLLTEKKKEGLKDDFLLLCEHEAVYTRGKGSKESSILNKNIPVKLINRGGDLTFHEKGQLVGYIIMDLKVQKCTVKEYLEKLQQVLINTLKQMDIQAEKHPELVGVWVGEKKIASIGIGLKKGITMHGFALNINNSMEGFSSISPCGLSHEIMTSVKHLTGKETPVESVQDILIKEFKKIF